MMMLHVHVMTSFVMHHPAPQICHRVPQICLCATAKPDDDPPFRTRSTARIEVEPFAEGADVRAAELAAELAHRGFVVDELLTDRAFRGSAALRHYSSFVYPKSEAALANAQKPQRAATIAQQISFLVREQKAAHAEWLCNVDRAADESAAAHGAARHPLYIVLDNIRSAHNVGNILRCAEAARCAHVHHCGITPMPPEPKVLKTAMGSAEYVPCTSSGSTLSVVRELRAQGVAVWCCETTARSVDYASWQPAQPLALVFGNELIGIDVQVMEECDGLVQIPTFGVKNSLNVATAASVLMWEALRQWQLAGSD